MGLKMKYNLRYFRKAGFPTGDIAYELAGKIVAP